jgi:hypothetical protein
MPKAQSDLGGFASCDLMTGEDIDIESSGDRWALNEVRNELVHPRIFFVCVELGIMLTLQKAQRKVLVGLGIRHKENLVHESRLVFKDWEDLMANGLSKLARFSLLGPEGDDSGEHSGLLLFEGSDRLRSPSDLIGPVRRNPWALEIRFAPDAASNAILNFLNLLFTSWVFDS